jgi:menaquinol-cytochrome c reductase cytochrome b/c subunit
MRRLLVLLAVLAAAGCGGDDPGEGSGPPRTTEGPNPTIADIPGDRASLGGQVAVRSGCLACHRLGGAGNAGPGPDLTKIGARLPASAIERTLLNPTPPMPSFASLPRKERKALVRYLASLR